MQIVKTFRKVSSKMFVLGIFVLLATFFLTFSDSTTQAQFNQEGTKYGECAYGKDCSTGGNPNNPPSGPGGTQGPGTPGFDDVNEQKVSTVPVLKEIEGLVVSLPEQQRRILPYFSWFLLCFLAVVLLAEALYDRHRASILAKSVDRLRKALKEQKNFSTVVLHNLNTPLAVAKSSLELLESVKPSEKKAIEAIRPTTMQLESVIEVATSGIVEEADSIEHINPQLKKSESLVSTTKSWYFILPVAASIIIGFVINLVLVRVGTGQSFFGIIFQLSVGVLTVMIFANAVRLLKVSRHVQSVMVSAMESIEKLRKKREQVIGGLSVSLSSIVWMLKQEIDMISNQQVAIAFAGGVQSLQEIADKVDIATDDKQIATSECNIAQLVLDSISEQKLGIDKKKLTVNTDIKIEGYMPTYVKELAMAVGTAVDNAVQYSNEAGQINIATKIDHGNAVITVEDFGVGMNKEAKDNLFQAFSKSDDLMTYNYQGLGLGLYVSRIGLKRVGGSIKVASEEAKGTKVTIKIPVYPTGSSSTQSPSVVAPGR